MYTYTWNAVYSDSSELSQFDGKVERSYKLIDSSKIVSLQLIHSNSKRISLQVDRVDDIDIPVYFRRMCGQLKKGGSKQIQLYVIGFEHINKQRYLKAIDSSGEIVNIRT